MNIQKLHDLKLWVERIRHAVDLEMERLRELAKGCRGGNEACTLMQRCYVTLHECADILGHMQMNLSLKLQEEQRKVKRLSPQEAYQNFVDRFLHGDPEANASFQKWVAKQIR